ncbi:MAG: UDP-N-acetylmuramoyl-L-alanyl-D-glutamate--2,6-diaminopimelate ligase, partial [Bacillota bacterium]|nr:UDP-N-acetylmuramoyl-L-alanyl-D-glutamate--2,6-diaminopimelate ligase [Bacillota bacterium]
MLLSSLLDHVSQSVIIAGDTNIEVLGVVNDSRNVRPGFVFVAIPGVKQNGATFAKEAVERGAVALLAEKLLPFDVGAHVVATDVREALGEMVSAFYSHPSRSMHMIGVTGTNGKTTVTYFLESILNEAGFSTGLIGTIETRYGGISRPSTHTSPDSPELQCTLKDMREAGVSRCVMELSSHALTLKRPAGCWLDGVGITNITHDHLDFHETWEAYRDSKLQAFELLRHKPNSFVVANMHDQSFAHVQDRWKERLFAFGFAAPAEIRLTSSKALDVGNELHIMTPGGKLTATTQLPGAHNIANALTAVGLAYAAGVGLEPIKLGLEKLERVPGRFQYVRGKRFLGVVDFAHNPDGLLQLLMTARTLTK